MQHRHEPIAVSGIPAYLRGIPNTRYLERYDTVTNQPVHQR